MSNNEFIKEKNLIDIMTLKVLKECIGKDILRDRNGHFCTKIPTKVILFYMLKLYVSNILH